jgi:hypothetical protein
VETGWKIAALKGYANNKDPAIALISNTFLPRSVIGLTPTKSSPSIIIVGTETMAKLIENLCIMVYKRAFLALP